MLSVILSKSHYLLYTLAASLQPRMLITFDEELRPLPVSVRVGQAVDVVGQAGKPKTITGFQTHTTPVLLAHGERAELATEDYVSLTPIMEGFVILRKKVEWMIAGFIVSSTFSLFPLLHFVSILRLSNPIRSHLVSARDCFVFFFLPSFLASSMLARWKMWKFWSLRLEHHLRVVGTAWHGPRFFCLPFSYCNSLFFSFYFVFPFGWVGWGRRVT